MRQPPLVYMLLLCVIVMSAVPCQLISLCILLSGVGCGCILLQSMLNVIMFNLLALYQIDLRPVSI